MSMTMKDKHQDHDWPQWAIPDVYKNAPAFLVHCHDCAVGGLLLHHKQITYVQWTFGENFIFSSTCLLVQSSNSFWNMRIEAKESQYLVVGTSGTWISFLSQKSVLLGLFFELEPTASLFIFVSVTVLLCIPILYPSPRGAEGQCSAPCGAEGQCSVAGYYVSSTHICLHVCMYACSYCPPRKMNRMNWNLIH